MPFDQLPEGVRVACEAGRDELLVTLGRCEHLAWAHESHILSSCPTQIKGGPDTIEVPDSGSRRGLMAALFLKVRETLHQLPRP
jgi:hypothetical protein